LREATEGRGIFGETQNSADGSRISNKWGRHDMGDMEALLA